MMKLKIPKRDVRSHLEISSTFLLFGCGIILLKLSVNLSMMIIAETITLASQVRLMFISHDIGHKILFRNKLSNQIWSIIIGGLCGSPIESKSIGHHIHHQYNGNLAVYSGNLLIISKQQYSGLDQRQKIAYRMSRHWLCLWVSSIIRYTVTPLLRLINGWSTKKSCKRNNLLAIEVINKSKIMKITFQETRDTLGATLLFSICLVITMQTNTLGYYLFNIVLVMWITDIIFHAQHNFKKSYASIGVTWEYEKALERGTCNFTFNSFGNWVTANIGMHQAHHKYPSIPFFLLKSIDDELKTKKYYKSMTIKEIIATRNYILWDTVKMEHSMCSIHN